MSLVVLDSDSAGSGLGARFRRTRRGPELDMVDTFLTNIPLHVPRGCRTTIFREPRIESGFPDLVIVVWRESITRDWSSYREALEPNDLRVMHFIHHAQRVQEVELTSRFGKRATRSICRLADAEMIRRSGKVWLPYSLSRSFAAIKIIAVEAKIGKWSDVLNQALLNTWFASKSYVLVPTPPKPLQLISAQERGIGVCSISKSKVHEVESESTELPRSYASWVFNDWAWKSSQKTED